MSPETRHIRGRATKTVRWCIRLVALCLLGLLLSFALLQKESATRAFHSPPPGTVRPIINNPNARRDSRRLVRSYYVWVRPALIKIMKDERARPLSPAVIRAARNEHEAFQIVLRAGPDGAARIKITKSDMVSKGGKIASSNISIFTERYVHLPKFGKDYPDPLPPYCEALTLSADETQPIWVNIYVPKEAAPGDYKGDITLEDAKGGKTEVPIQLRVYDFNLPEDWKNATAVALVSEEIAAQHQVKPNSPEHRALCRTYYEFLLTRGVSAYNLPLGVDIFSNEGGKYLKDPRMTSVITPLGTTRSQKSRELKRLRALGVLEKGYLYTADEPGYMDQYEDIKRQSKELHEIDPDARAMVVLVSNPIGKDELKWKRGAYYRIGDVRQHVAQGPIHRLSYLFECVKDHKSTREKEPGKGAEWRQYWQNVSAVKLLTGYIDLWVSSIASWEERAEDLELRLKEGDAIWSYTALSHGDGRPNYFIDYSPMDLRVMCWGNYRYGAVGSLYWRANYWSECSPDPWTDMDTCKSLGGGFYGEGSLIYPGYQVGIRGPVSSIRLETLRDSLEDYQYLWLLEQKAGRERVMQYVERLITSWNSYSKDPDLLTTFREEIAKELSGE